MDEPRAHRGRLGSAGVVLGVIVQRRVTNRPRWSREAAPGDLVDFVEPGVAGNGVPGLPARAGLGAPAPVHRLFGVYEAVSGCGIQYAEESWPGPDGWCEIRPPAKVLSTAEPANALDLAVAFAGACLDAGLHPVIAVLDPVAGGPSRVAVVVRVSGDWGAPGIGSAGGTGGGSAGGVLLSTPEWPGGLRTLVDEPGAFVAIDVTRIAAGWDVPGGADPAPFEVAVVAGAALLADQTLRWGVGIDIGRAYDPRDWPPSPHGGPRTTPTTPWATG